MFVMIFILFICSGRIYAACFNPRFTTAKVEFNKSFLSITTYDFGFRIKVQSLPLYLVFPDMDIRDEGNNPVKNYNNLFLEMHCNQYKVFTVWGIIKKKKVIKNIKLALVNLNKLQNVSLQKQTKHFTIDFYIFSQIGLSLKYNTFLC